MLISHLSVPRWRRRSHLLSTRPTLPIFDASVEVALLRARTTLGSCKGNLVKAPSTVSRTAAATS